MCPSGARGQRHLFSCGAAACGAPEETHLRSHPPWVPLQKGRAPCVVGSDYDLGAGGPDLGDLPDSSAQTPPPFSHSSFAPRPEASRPPGPAPAGPHRSLRRRRQPPPWPRAPDAQPAGSHPRHPGRPPRRDPKAKRKPAAAAAAAARSPAGAGSGAPPPSGPAHSGSKAFATTTGALALPGG